MKIQNATSRLNDQIGALKIKQAMDYEEVHASLLITQDSLHPMNQLKQALKEMISSSEAELNIINHVVGLTTGYLSKKAVIQHPNNMVKKILGSLLQFSIAHLVTKKLRTLETEMLEE